MTQTGSSNAIVNVMLGWLKGLASWVLRLFNLSAGFSPLKFLANNWLKLLVLLLIVGVAADLLIWLIRWRPHWVWFHKKRVIINDKNFFAAENDPSGDEDDWSLPAGLAPAGRGERRRRDWQDNDFVVAGAARRREEREREEERRRRERAARVKSMQLAAQAQSEVPDDVFTGEFNVNAKQKFSDRYEDEVFSVSNLPRPEEEDRPERRGGDSRAKRPASGAERSKARERGGERPRQRNAERPRQRSGERPARRDEGRPAPERKRARANEGKR